MRSAVRPCVLVAVLLGLFLMHGGPAAAAGGCHGGMPDTTAMRSGSGSAPASGHAVMAAHPAERSLAAHSMAAAPADRPLAVGAKAVPRAHDAMPGALCLAVTPRSEIPSAPAAAAGLVVPVALVLPWARRASGGTRRRGPPGGGRELLLQVCIART
ncbi:hypothetical protein BFF78_19765 [Streptomyces fodineus]|uniref:Uncharacterized protein n=1 Tax=Streptomyces fodineus TaxID=1904616 RepID=A0A1D7YNN3_9ACTN|nr:hypothetical protein BFF78_19765 [Streptomyces fodineus]